MRRLLVVATASLAILAAALAVAYAQATVEWIVYVPSTSLPLLAPFTVTVTAYDPANLETFQVECNVTITDEAGVVHMETVTGDPAVFNWTTTEEGAYRAELYCRADTGDGEARLTRTINLEYHYPAITVEPASPPWGRPVVLRIVAEYPYNEPVAVAVNETRVGGWFQDGVFLVGNYTLYGATAIAVEFLNKTTLHEVKPALPKLEAYAPAAVKTGEEVELRAALVDAEGYVPAPDWLTIHYYAPCLGVDGYYASNETVVAVAREPGDCEFTAEAVVAGETLRATTVVTVLPPLLSAFEAEPRKVDNWTYVVVAYAEFDAPANATLAVALDGETVSIDSGFKRAFNTTTVVRLDPGVHIVTVTLNSPYVEANKTFILYAPRHPQKIPVSDTWTWLGAPLDAVAQDYSYYLVPVNETHYLMVLYAPGDDYYLPAVKTVLVEIVPPRITIVEEDDGAYLKVERAMPGSKITVYAVLRDGSRIVVFEAKIWHTEVEAWIPDEHDTHAYYIAIYEAPHAKLVYVANEPEPVALPSTCIAGAPCKLPSSPWVEAVYIAGEYYQPGSEPRLPAGVYAGLLVLADGHTIPFELAVEPAGDAIVYVLPGGAAIVDAPEEAEVYLVLESGRVVGPVGPGMHAYWEPVVSAYSPYYDVRVHHVAVKAP